MINLDYDARLGKVANAIELSKCYLPIELIRPPTFGLGSF